jgi:hypothetical protein
MWQSFVKAANSISRSENLYEELNIDPCLQPEKQTKMCGFVTINISAVLAND